MSRATTVITGTVPGQMIELDQPSGLPAGQHVQVTVRPRTESADRLPPGEGLRRAAGAWADDPVGLDEFLLQVRERREQVRPPIEP